MARAACKPFNRGIAASKIIKSGRNLRALSTASNPSIASPHTPNWVWHSMKPRVVLRNTWLLSPIKIDLVILSPQVCPGDRPTLASTLHALPYQKSLLVTISISSFFVDRCGRNREKPEGLNTDSDVFCPDIVFRELYSSSLSPGSSGHRASFYPAMIRHRS